MELRWGTGTTNILVRGSHGEVYVSPFIIQGYNGLPSPAPQDQTPPPAPPTPPASEVVDEDEAA